MDLVDSVDLMGKVACYILLDNREQAEHYIKKLKKKKLHSSNLCLSTICIIVKIIQMYNI